jgi:hypothetical protein
VDLQGRSLIEQVWIRGEAIAIELGEAPGYSKAGCYSKGGAIARQSSKLIARVEL